MSAGGPIVVWSTAVPMDTASYVTVEPAEPLRLEVRDRALEETVGTGQPAPMCRVNEVPAMRHRAETGRSACA
jgi:hypothetical protein